MHHTIIHCVVKQTAVGELACELLLLLMLLLLLLILLLFLKLLFALQVLPHEEFLRAVLPHVSLPAGLHKPVHFMYSGCLEISNICFEVLGRELRLNGLGRYSNNPNYLRLHAGSSSKQVKIRLRLGATCILE